MPLKEFSGDFSDSAQRLLRNAEVRCDIRKRNPVGQPGITFKEFKIMGSGIFRNQRVYPFHFSDQSSGNGDKSGLSYHFSRFCKKIIFFKLCFQSISGDEADLLFVQITKCQQIIDKPFQFRNILDLNF